MKRFLTVVAAVVFVMGFAMTAPAADFADVMFLVDESGSMSGEHAWLGGMIIDLEAGLVAAGVGAGADANRYGLVTFGSLYVSGQEPIKETVGSGDWGTASELSTAASVLTAYGGYEDGYAAINYALSNYTFRAGAGLNIVLITDEDRDTGLYSGGYSDIFSEMSVLNALLNVVVDCSYATPDAASVLGKDSDGIDYYADDSGGYNTADPGTAVFSIDFGTTDADYVQLAWATGGAFWDLNKLRAGGLTATSFTKAFIDIKAEETSYQPPVGAPEPATLLLLGLGFLGIGVLRRR